MSQRFVDLSPCPNVALDDLDPEAIETYRRELGQRRPGSPLFRQPLERLLLQAGAATEEDGRLRPTLSGMLFFGREPQQWYPSFSVTFLQFAGTSTTRSDPNAPLYLDNREFQGTLPAMIEAARKALFERLSKKAFIEGFRRKDVPEIPEVAYREALVNALGHRDYGLEGSFVQIRLFADRLEIQSPGGLGGHLTVDNMAYEQYTRNPHIMRLLEEHGYVEQRGLGVDRMIRAMADASLEPPFFDDRGSSFWVTLKASSPAFRQPDLSLLDLNERQVRALHYLQVHGRITNRDYQTEFEVAERTALYDLQGLVVAGLALPVSSGRGRHYILRD